MFSCYRAQGATEIDQGNLRNWAPGHGYTARPDLFNDEQESHRCCLIVARIGLEVVHGYKPPPADPTRVCRNAVGFRATREGPDISKLPS